MKTSFLKTSFVAGSLALLPLLAIAQDKATVAISSIKPTASLLASANAKISTASQNGTKREAMTFDLKQELTRITESLDGQLIDRVNATRKFDVLSRSDLADIMKEQDLGAS